MKRMLFAVALCAALGMVTFYAQAPAAGQKPASADPYANNPDAGKQKFPLAAPAGKDSGAKEKPLAGAVNTGADRSGDLEVRTEQPCRRRARSSGTR